VKPDPHSPLRSPLLFPTGHKDLPPTYLAIAGADRSRDSCLIYEEVLRENGVKTRLDIFGGLIHGFWTVFPNAEFSKEYRRKADEALGWLYEQSKSRVDLRGIKLYLVLFSYFKYPGRF
jgi:acetyl esterase/lipase